MFPGLGGINPSQMKAMMSKMGIKQEEIDASRVVIEKNDGKRLIIDEPNVQKITMQGQVSWQITGDAHEESLGVSDDDVKLVMEKTGASKVDAKKALEETGDIAEAIVKLSE